MTPADGFPRYDHIEIRRQGAVAIMTLCHPERRNALDTTMAAEMQRAWHALEIDAGVRAVVLTGEGDHFCAGADLAAFQAADVLDQPVRFLEWSRGNFTPALLALAKHPKPVVAAVAGACVGVGWNIALACDLVVAADTARFSQIFVARGLVPDGGGTWLLPRYVGMMRARELLYSGRFVDADEARQLGLALDVVPADRLQDTAIELASRLADAPTRAIQLTKSLLAQSFRTELSEAMDQELTYQALLSSTHDMREGVESFLEKRQPNYIGD